MYMIHLTIEHDDDKVTRAIWIDNGPGMKNKTLIACRIVGREGRDSSAEHLDRLIAIGGESVAHYRAKEPAGKHGEDWSVGDVLESVIVDDDWIDEQPEQTGGEGEQCALF